MRSAPRGRRTGAFFDFDGTLIDGYSAMAMMQMRWRRREMSPLEIARLLAVGVEAGLGRADFERFMRVGVRAFRGRQADDMAELGEKLMRSVLGGTMYPEGWDLVAAHKRRGHTVVVATSALPFQVGPLARELGVDHVLCTELETRDGVLTGEVDGPILWGPGKAAAVREFAKANRIDLAKSFAYGNGSEDEQFLETVGRPNAVNATKDLQRLADERGWPSARFTARGRPGVVEVGRTVAAYSGLTAGLYAGLGVGLLKRSRKSAANTTMSLGSDVGLALGGIKLDVTGAEHLNSSRPAVFIFNHQSWLDGMIIMKLLRENVTAVAKKEVASQPIMGQIGWLLNMAYVDRSRPDAGDQGARAGGGQDPRGLLAGDLPGGHALADAARRDVQEGRVPHGHAERRADRADRDPQRRPAPVARLGFMRSGTVEINVLPPISVDDWTRDELDERVEEVRQMFVDHLEEWPSNGEVGR